MKKTSFAFLQVLTLLFGVAVLVFILVEPQFEGRNVGASFAQIYLSDAFLIGAYLAAIPFLTAVYKAFKVFGYARQEKLGSPQSVKSLRSIKNNALVFIWFVVIGEVYIRIGSTDDAAGGTFMGLLLIFGAALAAAIAERVEKRVGKRA